MLPRRAVTRRGWVGTADEGRAGWRFRRTNDPSRFSPRPPQGPGLRVSSGDLPPTPPRRRPADMTRARTPSPPPPHLPTLPGSLATLLLRSGGRSRGRAPRQRGSPGRTSSEQSSAVGQQPAAPPPQSAGSDSRRLQCAPGGRARGGARARGRGRGGSACERLAPQRGRAPGTPGPRASPRGATTCNHGSGSPKGRAGRWGGDRGSEPRILGDAK